MVDTELLKRTIRYHGFTITQIAEQIGMARETFWRRITAGGQTFSVGEVQKLMKCVPLSMAEVEEIFFPSD